ncbi:MAG TPA: amino acid adenylation domain-containing protein, partial [Cystobacter sp.]
MDEAERAQVLVEWNDTHLELPAEPCFPQLFEAQAALTPDALAASCDGEHLTYAQLNARANRLAHRLIAHGIGTDCIVPVLAPRGLSLLTSVLAVLKAGAAYLPLDPQHPPARLSLLLSQCRAPVVLHDDSLSELLGQACVPLSTPPRWVSVEDATGEPEHNPPTRALPDSLAYVISTSGSTGTPKSALLEHRGLLNHLHVLRLHLGLGPGDVIAQTASQSFDISVWQMLTAWLVGARTLVLPDDVSHHPERLLLATEALGVSILQSVPSLLGAMLEHAASLGPARPSLSRLRWMIPTGEALPPELCRRWFDAYPSIPLLNAYGPAECSDDVTLHTLHSAPSSLHTPIGRPVPNLRLYLLDSHLQPVPPGVPGELFVGGVGVGRGYLLEPSRTASVFLPDPFSSSPGARLYKTGDLARLLPDGALEFLGRADFQVKLRGFRIELGEIESALGAHPSVLHCAALVREDVPGQKRLVAYATARQGQSLHPDALRAHLHQRLPEYMVPSAFVFLDALPLSPNGKLDRKALPAPDLSASTAFVAPRSPTEQLLAGLWAVLLRLDKVGAHDHFFELGGHSLLATQLASRVRDTFGVELPLRALFESPTLSGLASALDSLLASSLRAPLAPPLLPAARQPHLPLSFSQQRLWFLD